MAIRRYVADADNTITNAYKSDLRTRATGSNTGKADVVEVYSIYGRQSTSSAELSRVLMKFPVTNISTDRTAGIIPGSGSVSFYLRVFNAETSKTVPRSMNMMIHAVSQSWQEGDGLDLENYKDKTESNEGSNWMSASNTQPWKDASNKLLVGGSYHSSSFSSPHEVFIFNQTLTSGLEDLEIDITPIVEQWIGSTYPNYGVGIFLTASQEAFVSGALGNVVKREPGTPDPADPDFVELYNPSGSTESYYTKRMFARGTQYFFKKPVIEARWNSSTRDDRGDFYYSSSLASGPDNLNTLYLFNYVRGRLANIPQIGSTGSIMVSLFSGSYNDTEPSGSRLHLSIGGGVKKVGSTSIYTFATGGFVSTGIYSCSLAITAASTPLKTLYDVWSTGSIIDGDHYKTRFFTGSIKPESLYASPFSQGNRRQVVNIKNLRAKYFAQEEARFNVYVRNKNWSPTIYTVASTEIESTIIPSASFRVFRVLDGLDVISHGTGSDLQTLLSYDVSGNYFNLDMSLLEPGYEYGIKFAFYDSQRQSWLEQDQKFLFRVEDYEY
jgi:hypothetical protein